MRLLCPPRYHRSMESPSLPLSRRTEDIALDLLKFVAAHTNVGRAAPGATTGFGLPTPAKADDQVAQLLELYTRCRKAVEAPAK